MIEHEDKIAAVRMSIGASGAAASALTLNEYVAIATIVYLVLQMGLLLPKYVQMARAWFKREK